MKNREATSSQIKSLRINKNQYKLMTKAGFYIDKFSYQSASFQEGSLIYWRRGDLQMVFLRGTNLTLEVFSDSLIRVSSYKTHSALRNGGVIWPNQDDGPIFKYKN